MADLIVFNKNYFPSQLNDVYVAKCTGSTFEAPYLAHEWACLQGESCHVADINGDLLADVVIFTQNATPGFENQVWAAHSNGITFGGGTQWATNFCFAGEECRLGNVDGRRGDDAIVFTKTAFPDSTNDVWVGLAVNGQLQPGQKWHDEFCRPGEVCRIGNVDASNRRADVISFVRDAIISETNFVRVVRSSPTLASECLSELWNDGSDSYCTAECPCYWGSGDCDGPTGGCAPGLVCGQDLGLLYKTSTSSGQMRSITDVCVPDACDPNPNGADGNASFCTATCKCARGHGDCDSDAQCLPGLICHNNLDNGPQFGLPAGYEACVPKHCDDNIQNFDETGVDCGGLDCGICI